MEVHDSLNYELFAVAVHLGRSIFSGHYVAYAKRNGKVLHYNIINSGIISMTLLFFLLGYKMLYLIMLIYYFLED